jgi:hypothetical protein
VSLRLVCASFPFASMGWGKETCFLNNTYPWTVRDEDGRFFTSEESVTSNEFGLKPGQHLWERGSQVHIALRVE